MKHTRKFWREHPDARQKNLNILGANEDRKMPDTIMDRIVEPKHEPTIEEIVEKQRDAKGRLLPGHSGNPRGMPPGTISLVRLLKKRLENHPDEADAIVNALVKLGKRGDMRAVEQLLDRIDGKVAETHRIEGEMPVRIVFVPALSLEMTEPVPELTEETETLESKTS